MNKTDTPSQGCDFPECADLAFPADGKMSRWRTPVLTVADTCETEAGSDGATESELLS